MPKFIDSPTIIEAPGNIPKIIKEFIGCVNTDNSGGEHCQDGKSGRLE